LIGAAGEGGLWRQPGIGWRVAANFIPVLGVLFDGWAALPLLVFFWIENVLTGVVGALKAMLCAWATRARHDWRASAAMLAFVPLHALFCLVHGLFIFALFALHDLVRAGVEPRHDLVDLPRQVRDVISAEDGMGWSIAALLAVQAGAFLFQWLPTGQWRDSTPRAQLREGHGGMLVLHGTLLVATVPVLLLGQPALAVLALAMLKSALDIGRVGRRSGGTSPD
jgi:hypothetical protein